MSIEQKARATVAAAVKSGELMRPPSCSQCAARRHVEGHHPDYRKPLDVVWLCRSCHSRHHGVPARKANDAARAAAAKAARLAIGPDSHLRPSAETIGAISQAVRIGPKRLAARTGISEEEAASILAGKSIPSLEVALKTANALNARVEWLWPLEAA